jgi:hypothetical protein
MHFSVERLYSARVDLAIGLAVIDKSVSNDRGHVSAITAMETLSLEFWPAAWRLAELAGSTETTSTTPRSCLKSRPHRPAQ